MSSPSSVLTSLLRSARSGVSARAVDSAPKVSSPRLDAIFQSPVTDVPAVLAAAGPHISASLAAQAFFITNPLPELVDEPAELERGRNALTIRKVRGQRSACIPAQM